VIQSDVHTGSCYAIVELLPEPKPVCTWPGRQGVLTLSKGWITRDKEGVFCHHRNKPYVSGTGCWIGGGNPRKLAIESFTDLPVFNRDLPWTEHIVEVGNEEKVVVKDEWNATTSRIVGRKIEDVINDHVEIGPILSADAELKDGWVAEDASRNLYWYSFKPSTKHSWPGEWLMVGAKDATDAKRLTDNEVIFPSSMPWDQRIVRIVGNKIVRDE